MARKKNPDFFDKLNETIGGLGDLLGRFQEMRREDSGDAERLPSEQPAPQPRGLTAYQILGVDPDTPIETIKKRWRKLCSIYHPDSGATDDSMFKKVNEAWEMIRRDKGLL
jgi:DnaJ-class molecular chaperone